MAALVLTPNLARPDDVYQMLVDSYHDLAADEVGTFHASLALILLNHVGDAQVAREAVAAARMSAQAGRRR